MPASAPPEKMTTMSEKILFVDDEPAVLLGFQRLLRNQFQITTAIGGAVGLLHLQHYGPFAVVVSDKRMPQMDGIEFLGKVKDLAPDTVRVMLTGETDLQTAIDAVNEGAIFRFLAKPCTKDVLAKTLTDCLAQYRLVNAEKELLEQTLRGCVHVLTEVLNLVSPAAFSRAARVRRYVRHVASTLSLDNLWKYEIAAMMSQLGCVTLDPDTVEAAYAGSELLPEQKRQYLGHPLVAEHLLSSIPRMESVAWMIAHQNQPMPEDWDRTDREMADNRLGVQILRAALAFDVLLHTGISRTEAAHSLTQKGMDKKILQAMVDLESEAAERGTRLMRIPELSLGMVLEQEIISKTGRLIAAKGQEVSSPVLIRLKNFLAKGAIDAEVAVSPSK